MADKNQHILLCDGCAAETGLNDSDHAIAPNEIHADAACEHCGAILVGFAYAVPANVYTGMVPGAG